MKRLASAGLIAVLVFSLVGFIGSLPAAAASPIAGSAFGLTWARTDLPVATGAVSRTWMWGPHADSGPLLEPYAESPGGERLVQYFDKSRMELTHPNGDPNSIWYVTNGLLANELITGRMQLGDNTFKQYAPAQVNVAGDLNDPNGPTYATFNSLMSDKAIPNGWVITQTVNRDGQVGNDPTTAAYGVKALNLNVPTHHDVASVFWSFMTSSGLVYQNGQDVQGALFPNAYYATGYPLTEAYWTTVLVGGKSTRVLVQVFQRRVMTYTPSNPKGWQVESGNVGLDYYQWRYVQLGQKPVADPNPPATWTPPPPANGKIQVSASVSNPHPSDYSNETVDGKFTDNGQPVSGVTMDTTWRYKTTSPDCDSNTGANGVAACTRDISDATIGYTVNIDVTFDFDGKTYTTTTSFTPK